MVSRTVTPAFKPCEDSPAFKPCVGFQFCCISLQHTPVLCSNTSSFYSALSFLLRRPEESSFDGGVSCFSCSCDKRFNVCGWVLLVVIYFKYHIVRSTWCRCSYCARMLRHTLMKSLFLLPLRSVMESSWRVSPSRSSASSNPFASSAKSEHSIMIWYGVSSSLPHLPQSGDSTRLVFLYRWLLSRLLG